MWKVDRYPALWFLFIQVTAAYLVLAVSVFLGRTGPAMEPLQIAGCVLGILFHEEQTLKMYACSGIAVGIASLPPKPQNPAWCSRCLINDFGKNKWTASPFPFKYRAGILPALGWTSEAGESSWYAAKSWIGVSTCLILLLPQKRLMSTGLLPPFHRLENWDWEV